MDGRRRCRTILFNFSDKRLPSWSAHRKRTQILDSTHDISYKTVFATSRSIWTIAIFNGHFCRFPFNRNVLYHTRTRTPHDGPSCPASFAGIPRSTRHAVARMKHVVYSASARRQFKRWPSDEHADSRRVITIAKPCFPFYYYRCLGSRSIITDGNVFSEGVQHRAVRSAIRITRNEHFSPHFG